MALALQHAFCQPCCSKSCGGSNGARTGYKPCSRKSLCAADISEDLKLESWSHLQAADQALVLVGEALGICVLALVHCSLELADVPHGAIQRPLSQRHTQSLQADTMHPRRPHSRTLVSAGGSVLGTTRVMQAPGFSRTPYLLLAHSLPKSWWLPLAMPSMGHPCYRNGSYQVGSPNCLHLGQRTSMHTLSMLCASSNTTTHSFSSSRDTILDTCNQPGIIQACVTFLSELPCKEAIVRAPCCLRARSH